jgi:hypothetical protein
VAEAPAFATAADLAARLGRAVWDDPLELARVEELLSDATAHLRAAVGWQVSPPATVTTRVSAGGDSVFRLPGAPVTAVTGITSGGTTLSPTIYELVDGAVEFTSGRPIGATVTYTVGYATPPRDLVSWTCVLASQALSALEELGALGGGGVSSIAIDDFRKAWADGGDGAGFVLPGRVEDKLRRQYGGGGAHVSGA